MQIQSLEQAETIVQRNKQLSWDGWNIVRLKPNKAGWMQRNGAFKDGQWFEKTVYEPNCDGWKIPDFLKR